MSDERLEAIEQKLDRYHTDIMNRFHGERGDNGVYGRLQSLEERARAREKRESWLWGLAGSSGASAIISWIVGHK